MVCRFRVALALLVKGDQLLKVLLRVHDPEDLLFLADLDKKITELHLALEIRVTAN